MQVAYAWIHGSIRFSLSRYTTEEDIFYIIKKLPPVINQLRKIASRWQKMGEYK
jgi:cysteine desulfurase